MMVSERTGEMAAFCAETDGGEAKTLPRGVWPVMLTPFRDDGALDWRGVDALVDWYIDRGVAGLFAVCLSSEMDALTADERDELASRILVRADGRVPVVVGCGHEGDPDVAARVARGLADRGAAAAVLIANRFAVAEAPEADWLAAMDRILNQTAGIPLGLYECPDPYKRLVSPDALRTLGATGRFLFLKETSVDPGLLARKQGAAKGTPLNIYNAHSPTLLESVRRGGAGCSNIAANAHPDLFAWLCRNFDTEPDTADSLQRFLTLADPVVRLGYPLSAKRFLAGEGLPIRPVCRVACPARPEGDLEALHDALRYEQRRWRERLAGD